MKLVNLAMRTLFRFITKPNYVVLLMLLGLASGAPAYAPPVMAAELDEYRVKTAFIYNFLAFTQWPDWNEQTFNMCVYGTEHFGREIDALQEKTINDTPIRIIRIVQLDELKRCQAFFFSQSAQMQLSAMLEFLQGAPVLTIADSANAASMGAMITMHLDQNRVKFEINLKSARDAQLMISSRLLQLATQVHQ
ncbi:MAG: YfiR family protein [Nitrosomonas sp.]|jgi:hypothetical protein|nr:YfiR family protein [Nitrosomonas sp.]